MKNQTQRKIARSLVLLHGAVAASASFANTDANRALLLNALPDAKLAFYADQIKLSTSEPRNVEIFSMICRKGSEAQTDPEKMKDCKVIAKSESIQLNYVPAYFMTTFATRAKADSSGFVAAFQKYAKSYPLIHANTPVTRVDAPLSSLVQGFIARKDIQISNRLDVEFRVGVRVQEINPRVVQKFVLIDPIAAGYGGFSDERYYDKQLVVSFIPGVKNSSYVEFPYNPFDLKRSGAEEIGVFDARGVSLVLSSEVKELGPGKTLYAGEKEIKSNLLPDSLFGREFARRALKKKSATEITVGDTLRIVNAYGENSDAKAFVTMESGKIPSTTEFAELSALPAMQASLPEILDSFGEAVVSSISDLQDLLAKQDPKVNLSFNREVAKAAPAVAAQTSSEPARMSHQEEFYKRQNDAAKAEAAAALIIGGAAVADEIFSEFMKNIR